MSDTFVGELLERAKPLIRLASDVITHSTDHAYRDAVDKAYQDLKQKHENAVANGYLSQESAIREIEDAEVALGVALATEYGPGPDKDESNHLLVWVSKIPDHMVGRVLEAVRSAKR